MDYDVMTEFFHQPRVGRLGGPDIHSRNGVIRFV